MVNSQIGEELKGIYQQALEAIVRKVGPENTSRYKEEGGWQTNGMKEESHGTDPGAPEPDRD